MKIFIADLASCGVNYEKDFILNYLSPTLVKTNILEDADIVLMVGGCCCTEPQLVETVRYIRFLLKKKKETAITYLIGCITKEFTSPTLSELITKKLFNQIDYIYSQYNPNDLIKQINGYESIQKDVYGAYYIGDIQGDIYIQNGCTHHCSFCKTNYTKCRLIDTPLEKIKQYLNELNDENIKTVQLRGLNISQYGLDLYKSYKLLEICEYIEEYTNIEEIILSNFAFSDAIKNGFANRLKYLKKDIIINGSLESGSNRLLKLMNKGFTKEEFLEFYYQINSLHKRQMALNIISGFPTETKDDIYETLEVLKEVKPFRVNINTYLDSQFTPSHNLEQLSEKEIEKHTKVYTRSLRKNKIKYDINGFN